MNSSVSATVGGKPVRSIASRRISVYLSAIAAASSPLFPDAIGQSCQLGERPIRILHRRNWGPGRFYISPVLRIGRPLFDPVLQRVDSSGRAFGDLCWRHQVRCIGRCHSLQELALATCRERQPSAHRRAFSRPLRERRGVIPLSGPVVRPMTLEAFTRQNRPDVACVVNLFLLCKERGRANEQQCGGKRGASPHGIPRLGVG